MDLESVGLPPETTATPPSYSPSTATPSYSHQPRENEERLAITARNGARANSLTGTFSTNDGKMGCITLQLNYQEEGASVPCFGRNSIINGRIGIVGPKHVQQVQVEVSIVDHPFFLQIMLIIA